METVNEIESGEQNLATRAKVSKFYKQLMRKNIQFKIGGAYTVEYRLLAAVLISVCLN
jgi:hypothetical protein